MNIFSDARPRPAREPDRFPVRPENLYSDSPLGHQWTALGESEARLRAPGGGLPELARLGDLAVVADDAIAAVGRAGIEAGDALLLGEMIARRRLELITPRLEVLTKRHQDDVAAHFKRGEAWREAWSEYLRLRTDLLQEAARARKREQREKDPDPWSEHWRVFDELRGRVEKMVGSVELYAGVNETEADNV